MRNKFFKFNENYAKVIKHLDDRQAGQYVRAISDYAFEGKTYGGKDTAVKTAFTLTKQMIDDEKFYREKGRIPVVFAENWAYNIAVSNLHTGRNKYVYNL